MFSAFVLICALGTAPSDCDIDRHVAIIALGLEFRDSLGCLHGAQIEAAKPEHAGKFKPATYPKFVCHRWRPANQG
jgi:hypothetical protein